MKLLSCQLSNISFYKTSALVSLTALQKKILAIAVIALNFLALIYLCYRKGICEKAWRQSKISLNPDLLKKLEEGNLPIAEQLDLAKKVGYHATRLVVIKRECTAQEFEKLIKLSPNAEHIVLGGEQIVTNDYLKILTKNKKLKTLEMYWGDLTKIDLTLLPENLEAFHLYHCNLAHINIGHLTATHLKSFSLYHCDATNVSLNDLPVSLKKFSFSKRDENIGDTSLFCKLPKNLTELKLVGCRITNEFLKQLPKLTNLYLNGCDLIDVSLDNLPLSLEELYITYCSLKNISFDEISSNIQSITLKRCTDLMNNALEKLNIRSLALHFCDLSGQSLPASIQDLTLSFCNLAGLSLEKLNSLKSLALTSFDFNEIHKLPQNLESFKIALGKNLTNLILDHLPKSMRILEFAFCDLPLNYLNHFSQQLHSLSLFFCNNVFIDICDPLSMKKLPSGLKHFNLMDYDMKEKSVSDIVVKKELSEKVYAFSSLFLDHLPESIDTHLAVPLLHNFSKALTDMSGQIHNNLLSSNRLIVKSYSKALKNKWITPLFHSQKKYSIEEERLKLREKCPVRALHQTLSLELGLDEGDTQARIQALEMYDSIDEKPLKGDELCEKIKKGELVIIPAGSRDYGIALVFYGSFMVICNRGAGSPYESSTMKYVPIDPNKFTNQIYEEILTYRLDYWNKGYKTNHNNFYYNWLPQILKPLKGEKDHLQVVGEKLQHAYESHKFIRVPNSEAISLKLANRAALALQVFKKTGGSLDEHILKKGKRYSKSESYLIRQYFEDANFLIKNRAKKIPGELSQQVDQTIEQSKIKRLKMAEQYALLT